MKLHMWKTSNTLSLSFYVFFFLSVYSQQVIGLWARLLAKEFIKYI